MQAGMNHVPEESPEQNGTTNGGSWGGWGVHGDPR